MSSGIWIAIVFVIFFIAFFVLLIKLITKSEQKQREAFTDFAKNLGTNQEIDTTRGSVKLISNGRPVRIFMSKSTRFSFANLEMTVKDRNLKLEMHNARPFQQSETPTGRSDFDSIFHIESNDTDAVRQIFTEDLCSLLMRTPDKNDIHSVWTIDQGRLHYQALPPVSQSSTGLENPEFQDRFRLALEAANMIADRLDNRSH